MNDVSRRDVLKGIVAATFIPTILSCEQFVELAELELPAKAPVWMPKGGIDFDGILNMVHFRPIASSLEGSWEQCWFTQPDGTILLNHRFHSHSFFQWVPGTEAGRIHGPINIACSGEADISLISDSQSIRLYKGQTTVQPLNAIVG